MKLIYDEFEEYWIWVSLEDENNELSPAFDERQYALKWLIDITKALGYVQHEK
jgi:hypothetical protein